MSSTENFKHSQLTIVNQSDDLGDLVHLRQLQSSSQSIILPFAKKSKALHFRSILIRKTTRRTPLFASRLHRTQLPTARDLESESPCSVSLHRALAPTESSAHKPSAGGGEQRSRCSLMSSCVSVGHRRRAMFPRWNRREPACSPRSAELCSRGSTDIHVSSSCCVLWAGGRGGQFGRLRRGFLCCVSVF